MNKYSSCRWIETRSQSCDIIVIVIVSGGCLTQKLSIIIHMTLKFCNLIDIKCGYIYICMWKKKYLLNICFYFFQPDNSPGMAEGVMVSRIAEGGQADVKGMQLYDKIVKVMGTIYLQ